MIKNNRVTKLLLKLVVCMFVVLMLVPTFAASAVSEKTDEIGYDTYTYWYEFTGQTRKAVPSKPMYEIYEVMTKEDLGCIDASSINDAHVSKSGFMYVLDGGASKLHIFDTNYNLVKTISVIIDGEYNHYFTKAEGVYVDDNENIYIADRNNKRVIKCDGDGNLIRFYTLPDSHLIPDGFNYQPVKVAVDSKGYVYILSSGSYYGAILYSPTDEFLGFYGSNDVTASLMQALTTLWNRLFMNNTKRSQMTKTLPYAFSDLWIDDMGFVYTSTGTTNEIYQNSQIKKLNPGGANILASNGVNFADEGYSDTLLSGTRYQNLIGIAADKQGYIYTVDATYGRVFIYDSNCTMISAFGGGVKSGTQDGTFHTPSAIAYNINNDDVIVTDKYYNTLTIFRITDYGKLIKSAQAKTIVGDYEEAMDEWTDVLEQDSNCQLAYAGLAKAYYVMGQSAEDEALAVKYNDKAIELSKEGYDRATYSLAFGSERTKFLRENFTWVLLIAIALIGLVIFALVYSTKHKVRLIKNQKVHLAATLATHPFENFREIKEKGLTSAPICFIIIILYYMFTVMETTLGGFSFVYFDPSSYNALLILAKTAGIVILWTFCNWAVCTLFGGKGKMKEIFTVISYSLIPSLFGSVVFVVCTNVLVPDEAAFLSILSAVCTGYTLILLAIGTMRVHDYGFGKFFGTTLLTLLGCAIIVFLLIVVIILLQQTWGFIVTIYSEILKLF